MASDMFVALGLIHEDIEEHKHRHEVSTTFSKLTSTSVNNIGDMFRLCDISFSAEAIRLFLMAAIKVQKAESQFLVQMSRCWSVYHGETNDLLIVAASLFCRAVQLISEVIVIPNVCKVARTHTPRLKSMVIVGQALRDCIRHCQNRDMTAHDYEEMSSGVSERLRYVEGLYVAEVGLFQLSDSRMIALYCFYIAVDDLGRSEYTDWLLDCAWRVAKETQQPFIARACINRLVETIDDNEAKHLVSDEESGGEYVPDKIEQITRALRKHQEEIELYIKNMFDIDAEQVREPVQNCYMALLVDVSREEISALIDPVNCE